MKSILIFGFTLSLMQSCVFTKIDDSINLGNKYRYIQDYPQTIIFHRSIKYEGTGKEIVPPNVKTYSFDSLYIIAKSISLEDKKLKYWIVDKRAKGAVVRPLDSTNFYQQLKELEINLKF
jgi:hypothetical protein